MLAVEQFRYRTPTILRQCQHLMKLFLGQTLKRRPEIVDMQFIRKMAARSNEEIANYFAEMMAKDLTKVNKSLSDEFPNYAPPDQKMINSFANFLIEYLNKPCPINK